MLLVGNLITNTGCQFDVVKCHYAVESVP